MIYFALNDCEACRESVEWEFDYNLQGTAVDRCYTLSELTYSNIESVVSPPGFLTTCIPRFHAVSAVGVSSVILALYFLQ